MENLRELYLFLSDFLSEHKKARFAAILEQRSRYITVVLEDLYQDRNASAVLRSCDCSGIQDVHVIENSNPHNISRDVARGAGNWLNISRYNEHENNTAACLTNLKKSGYQIIATSPHTDDCMISELDLSRPVALVFGNEKRGISKECKSMADGFVKIPMLGFTESYNISVAAALCLFELSQRMRNESRNWELSEEEKLEILLSWTQQSINRSETLVNEFYRRKQASRH